ncbi:MAG: bifunctional diaminohydroxyphosphoribosylaminopyrimidine deaminase/5-amino-6-(5-phosphoribosylamino)uracil reductase RibD [Acidimicrobiia bacterium]
MTPTGDDALMRRAMDAARHDHPHPNPRVGAVLVAETGEVVSTGSHRGPGEPHAEVVALNQAGAGAKGGTLYVTLEPCSHYGRTPPCVSAIATSQVARVVVGAIDPDERVSGSGVSWLRDAGIRVDVLPGDEYEQLDPGYFRHRRSGLPRITLKWAMTLDGSVAALDSSSQWITSEEAREDAHRLRAEADAVVVGAGTLRSDDPLLTARTEPEPETQPSPVIVAGVGELPHDRRLWQRDPIVVSTCDISIPSGELVVVEGGAVPDPASAARALAEAGFLDLLLEGGPTLAAAWWRAGLVNKGVVYVAGRIGGGKGLSPFGGDFATMSDLGTVAITDVRRIGADVRLEFE